jgi:UTP--glucose-1-phosphate uridylyltransferase
MQFDWKRIRAEFRELIGGLEGIELDCECIERFAADIRAGRINSESNRMHEPPEPPADEDVDDMAALGAAQRARLEEIGRRALERGEVAAAVLNGGMATRFGGSVKGIVEAVGGLTFLEIKLRQVTRLGPVPLLVMNSFATHRATLEFIEQRRIASGIRTFLQGASLRLTPNGDLFRDDAGRLSPYAPGHGDFPEHLAGSGLLAELERQGVRVITLSNVDNLGADPNPVIIGYHLEHGRPITVEVARTIPGDVGGAPARVDGKLQLVEGFRFPQGFDFARLPFVNTNTFVFSTEALARSHSLSWFYVEKKVDGRTAVQMERLVGELSVFEPSAYLAVPRAGPDLRYFPVKTQEDLEALRSDRELVARFLAA